ncbi:MAG: cupredoxin domain-containing protein [Thaumarchaeota archaeon]|nr:cupredoxin domain-containing protein [Nitrososphaerota archaeon]
MRTIDTFDCRFKCNQIGKMRASVILFTILIGSTGILSAFAQESSVSVNITGGSDAGQSCVSAKNCYEPNIASIPAKTTVMWTNMDSTPHTVTSGKPSGNEAGTTFDSGMMAPGSTYSFMFMSPGTYDYFCSIHPWMTGEVIVGATSPSSNSATTPEFGSAAIFVFIISFFVTVLVVKNNSIFRF